MICKFQRQRAFFPVRSIDHRLLLYSRQTLKITAEENWWMPGESYSTKKNAKLVSNTFKYNFMIYFLDYIKCNGTDPHTAYVGQNITYSCSFTYQGHLFDGYFTWRDSLGNVLEQEQREVFLHRMYWSTPATCYRGESTLPKLHNRLTGMPRLL